MMERRFISTRLGKIAVHASEGPAGPTPLIFLHGIYFDHKLWEKVLPETNDRQVIAIDMPMHGESKEGIPDHWNIDDCGEMLVEILDALKIPEVIAIGHSWGSMTVLRATVKYPRRFAAAGFCNMPFEAATPKVRRQFRMQHLALAFRGFYTRQVSKALYGRQHRRTNPGLHQHLLEGMSKLSKAEIMATDRTVIIEAEDTSKLIASLKVPALALKGREDYVPAPPGIETTLVEGGHVSPLEVWEEVAHFAQKVIKLG